MKKLILAVVFISFQASASTYVEGKFSAAASCQFDFEVGNCKVGEQCWITGAGWSKDVVMEIEIFRATNGISQRIRIQPFPDDLEKHFDLKAYPDLDLPHAGLGEVFEDELNPKFKSVAYSFDRRGGRKLTYQVVHFGDSRVRFARYGTVGRANKRLDRNFECEITL